MAPKPEDFPTPGQYIRALLDERGWNQRTLALVLGLDYGATNRMIQDKKPIDAFAALMLGDVFDVEPDVFLDLRKKFELAVARASTRPDSNRALRAALFGDLPVGEMMKRGWLPGVEDFRDLDEVERALMHFFGVESVEKIPTLPHAPRKTDVGGEPTPAQIAWLHRVRQIASTLQVPRYSPSAVRAAIEKLEPLLASADGARKVAAILAEAGVRYVVVESISTAKIDGVCTWLNDMAPVIGMTLRHDRIDNFWFVLRHECEHIIAGHGRRNPRVDVELEERPGSNRLPEEERIANAAAADFCVPSAAMETFYGRKKSYFQKHDVLGFAASVRRHPGLVIGQLQHRAHRFDRFREYLAKVRTLVIPGVAADGWGTTYPVNDSARVA
jgi:HTH-type transcriptional regulator/antitoxin HigA